MGGSREGKKKAVFQKTFEHFYATQVERQLFLQVATSLAKSNPTPNTLEVIIQYSRPCHENIINLSFRTGIRQAV